MVPRLLLLGGFAALAFIAYLVLPPDWMGEYRFASVAFPASYLLGYGVFVAHPDIGPSWKIRAAIVLLLPRTRK